MIEIIDHLVSTWTRVDRIGTIDRTSTRTRAWIETKTMTGIGIGIETPRGGVETVETTEIEIEGWIEIEVDGKAVENETVVGQVTEARTMKRKGIGKV